VIPGEERAELRLRCLEERLVVPERVVGVERDEREQGSDLLEG
jgi:hypothetical protein